jgi:hypothetical protein
MSNQLTASVHKVLDTQTFESGFTKRVLVLRTTGDYPKPVPFEFFKDKTTLLDNLTEGQMVTVHFNVEGSEWKEKFYPKLVGWKIDTEENGSAVIAEVAREKALNGDMANQFNEQQDGLDLPF